MRVGNFPANLLKEEFSLAREPDHVFSIFPNNHGRNQVKQEPFEFVRHVEITVEVDEEPALTRIDRRKREQNRGVAILGQLNALLDGVGSVQDRPAVESVFAEDINVLRDVFEERVLVHASAQTLNLRGFREDRAEGLLAPVHRLPVVHDPIDFDTVESEGVNRILVGRVEEVKHIRPVGTRQDVARTEEPIVTDKFQVGFHPRDASGNFGAEAGVE